MTVQASLAQQQENIRNATVFRLCNKMFGKSRSKVEEVRDHDAVDGRCFRSA